MTQLRRHGVALVVAACAAVMCGCAGTPKPKSADAPTGVEQGDASQPDASGPSRADVAFEQYKARADAATDLHDRLALWRVFVSNHEGSPHVAEASANISRILEDVKLEYERQLVVHIKTGRAYADRSDWEHADEAAKAGERVVAQAMQRDGAGLETKELVALKARIAAGRQASAASTWSAAKAAVEAIEPKSTADFDKQLEAIDAYTRVNPESEHLPAAKALRAHVVQAKASWIESTYAKAMAAAREAVASSNGMQVAEQIAAALGARPEDKAALDLLQSMPPSVEIEVKPIEAKLLLDGGSIGTGKASVLVDQDHMYMVEAVLDGYQKAERLLLIDRRGPRKLTIELEKLKPVVESPAIYDRVVEYIRDEYVEEITLDTKARPDLAPLLNQLDAYATYYTGQDLADFRADTKGQFGGLGIEITMRENMLTVVTPLVGTPAFRAGVEAGDKIVKIDGNLTKGIQLKDAVKVLRGKPGTSVTITVARASAPTPVDITIVRAIIKIASVRATQMIDEQAKIGYVWLTSFQEQTSAQLTKAIEGLLAEGMRALVLDLRSNSGGLLDQSVKVADTFIERGQLIVEIRGRSAIDRRVDRAERDVDKRLAGMPMVVLIDQGSASASEIVAGALRDHGRAAVVGTHSFGKGSVQTILPIGRAVAALKLTTAYYYTPSGMSIHGNRRYDQGEKFTDRNGNGKWDPGEAFEDEGTIKPDVRVPLTAEQRKKLGEYIREQHLLEHKDETRRHRYDLKTSPDIQLKRAVEMLRGK